MGHTVEQTLGGLFALQYFAGNEALDAAIRKTLQRYPSLRSGEPTREGQMKPNKSMKEETIMANYLEEEARDMAKIMLDSALTYHMGLLRGDNYGRNLRSPYLLNMRNGMASFLSSVYELDQGNYWGKSNDEIPEDEDLPDYKAEEFKKSSDLNYLLETKSPKEMLQMIAKYNPDPHKAEVERWELLKPDEIMANMSRELAKEKPNRDRERSIAAELKQTTSKSFSGKLKSWFVGNSKEYDKALKAMQDVSEGKVSKEKAKESIMDYLDIRKNKVRDHQYGRERFDGFMKGLQTLMEPQEFADYCKGVDDARRARDPNYRGVTNPEDYMPDRSSQDLVNETAKQAQKEGYEPTARETAKLLAAMQMGYADHDKPLNSRSVRERTDQIMADPDFQEWFNTREPGQIKKFVAEDPNRIGEYKHALNQERGEREAKQAEAAEIEADFAELAGKGGKGMGAPIQRKENFQREDFIEDDLFEELNKADLDKKLEQSKGPEL
ncbi:MAG: hypothetical protein IJV64_01640 [Oscillospiraceae bacterium]|nr:hypothetical protein [Oscillospiraceae bacterium]